MLGGAVRLAVVTLHATLTFLIVSQLGALWSVHMRIGRRHHKNLKTDLGLVTILLRLLFTEVGIYYAVETGLCQQAANISSLALQRLLFSSRTLLPGVAKKAALIQSGNFN